LSLLALQLSATKGCGLPSSSTLSRPAGDLLLDDLGDDLLDDLGS
jgi:hypothetical protein